MLKTGLEDLVTKVATRAGLRRIRRALTSGNWAEANRMAKTPGYLPPVKDLSTYAMPEDTGLPKPVRLNRARSPGHQIRGIGRGQEQATTLVADPQYGVVLRKSHLGDRAVTVPEQMDLKAALGRQLTDEQFPHAPDFYEAFEGGPAGRKMHLVEYIQRGPQDNVAEAKAFAEYIQAAARHGFKADDLWSKGNLVTDRAGVGIGLDPMVSRLVTPGKDTLIHGHPGPGKIYSHGDAMRDIFRPPRPVIDKYEQHLGDLEEAAIEKANRARRR